MVKHPSQKAPQFSARLDPELAAAFRSYCKQEGLNQTKQIEKMIREWLVKRRVGPMAHVTIDDSVPGERHMLVENPAVPPIDPNAFRRAAARRRSSR